MLDSLRLSLDLKLMSVDLSNPDGKGVFTITAIGQKEDTMTLSMEGKVGLRTSSEVPWETFRGQWILVSRNKILYWSPSTFLPSDESFSPIRGMIFWTFYEVVQIPRKICISYCYVYPQKLPKRKSISSSLHAKSVWLVVN